MVPMALRGTCNLGEPKTAMDRTQPGVAGTKAKAKNGEVLTPEGTEGAEKDCMIFLCVLWALCGLASLASFFLSVSQLLRMAPKN